MVGLGVVWVCHGGGGGQLTPRYPRPGWSVGQGRPRSKARRPPRQPRPAPPSRPPWQTRAPGAGSCGQGAGVGGGRRFARGAQPGGQKRRWHGAQLERQGALGPPGRPASHAPAPHGPACPLATGAAPRHQHPRPADPPSILPISTSRSAPAGVHRHRLQCARAGLGHDRRRRRAVAVARQHARSSQEEGRAQSGAEVLLRRKTGIRVHG
jgi:hypothetical protein